MYALTVHQPWAHAILAFDKVENRTWKPHADALGQRIAIHAGKTVRHDDIDALVDQGYELPELAHGAIVGTALLRGWVERPDTTRIVKHSGLVGRALALELQRAGYTRSQTLSDEDAMRAFTSPWFHGPIGWVFTEPKPLRKPIPMPGAQGLWRVPAVVERLL